MRGKGYPMVATHDPRLIRIAGAMALAPLLGSVLYNVQTRDPYLMTLAATILVLVALLASAIPARRAASIDPAVVLRAD
jgi:ABC-type lipoprotein release transport system permease subunit